MWPDSVRASADNIKGGFSHGNHDTLPAHCMAELHLQWLHLPAVSPRVHLESSHTFPSFLQDDKDLVHEFVVAEGLTCLIKVGAEADQNYQNYILRGTSTRATLSLPRLKW